jgi:hypothetical protein
MKNMKNQIIIAIATILATTCGAIDNIATPREPPINAPHGGSGNGLTLGIWSEADTYELNARMNVWIILSNTNKDTSGRPIPYNPTIHTNDDLLITDSQTNLTKISTRLASDGPVGLGFESCISSQLHDHLLHPGLYTLQWKIGKLESNVITLRIVEATDGSK